LLSHSINRSNRISTSTAFSSLPENQALHTEPIEPYKPPSLQANVSWTFWGNAVNSGCQWGIVVLLAKLGNPTMVGQYALGLAIVSPILLFAYLQLRAIQATDVNSDFSFGDYFGVRLLAAGAALAVVLASVALGSYGTPTALTIISLAVSKSVDGISDIFYGFLQQHERLDCIARSMLIRSPLSLVGMGAAIYIAHSVFIGATALAVVSAVVLITYDIPVSRRLANILWKGGAEPSTSSFAPRWNGSRVKKLVYSSVPLGCVMLLISLQTNIPRYFIEHFQKEAAVGIFAALAYVLAAGNIVTDAVGQSITPRLARLYRQNDRSGFRRILSVLAGVGAVAGVLAVAMSWAFGQEILALLYKPEYVKHMDVFLLLMASAAPTYIASFFGYAMTASRLFWVQLPLSAVSALSVAILCWLLIPTRGLRGAAEAVFVVSLIRLFTVWIIVGQASKLTSVEA
jgi:O-antigen/teichoic acid export membrane protein